MIGFLSGVLNAIISILASVLPTSPFQSYVLSPDIQQYLAYANWLFPFGDCLTILTVVLGIVATVRVTTFLVNKSLEVGEAIIQV